MILLLGTKLMRVRYWVVVVDTFSRLNGRVLLLLGARGFLPCAARGVPLTAETTADAIVA